MTLDLQQLASAVLTLMVGGIAYLVKHYLASFKKDLSHLSLAIAKLEGKVDSLSNDVRENTVEMAVSRKEFEAVWRAIDGAYGRASDSNKGQSRVKS